MYFKQKRHPHEIKVLMITKLGILPKTNSTLEKYEVTEEDKKKHPEFDFTEPKIQSEEGSSSDDESENKSITDKDTLIFSVVNSEEDFVEISKYENGELEKFTDILIYDEILDAATFEFNDKVYMAISLEDNISIYDIFIYNSLNPQITLDQQKVENMVLDEMNLIASSETFLWTWDLPSLEVSNTIDVKENITGLFKTKNLFLSTNEYLWSIDYRSNEINKLIKQKNITKVTFESNLVFIGDGFGSITAFDIRKPEKAINQIKSHEKAISCMEIKEGVLIAGSIDTKISILDENLKCLADYQHFEPVTAFSVLEFKNNSFDLVIGGIGEEVCLKTISF